jgi:AraC-like DNA-binding protein
VSISRHHPPTLSQSLLGHQGRVEWHDHARHQLLYPSSGVISVTTRAGTWVVPPLRAIWLPAGEPHAHLAHGPVQLCSVMLAADDDPLGVTGPTLLAVSALLREVLLALTAPGTLRDDRRAPLEAVALDELEPVPTAPCRLPEPADDRLRAIAAALLADPGDTRTLAQLGQAVGASERTLSRLFRAETGMSFPQWRAQFRLHAALVGLAGGATVAAVAHGCGYATASAFIASFRRAFGDTPGSFRGPAGSSYRAPAGSASVRPKSPS